jgi:hypothetical protein
MNTKKDNLNRPDSESYLQSTLASHKNGRRHLSLLMHYGCHTTVLVWCCSSTQEDSSPSACLRGLARHFKTEPTETVALCFGNPKTTCRRSEGKLSTSVDEQHISDQARHFKTEPY